ncbi:hypothetical protein QUF75_19100 [Desulfococcaceae bacterium HSG7]|nr:hypothetical protein [Desulfococcaceae bacterium HSG7]
MKKISKIKFDTPEHGWIEIVFNLGKEIITMDVADTIDSIKTLCLALINIYNGSLSENVAWPNEPGYYTWEFKSIDSQIYFSITEPNGNIISTKNNKHEFFVIFISSLNLLSQNPIWERDLDNNIAWSSPFPTKQLNELKKLAR